MPDITPTQFAAALRALADVYEAHPEMAVPQPLDIFLAGTSRESFAQTVKALGSVDKLAPRNHNDYFYTVEKQLAGVPVRFSVARDIVCRKVRKLMEVDTWECDSILEAANAPND